MLQPKIRLYPPSGLSFPVVVVVVVVVELQPHPSTTYSEQENPMHITRPTIGIVIPKDYFQRAPLRGNSGDYRSVLEITEAVNNAGGRAQLLFPDSPQIEVDGLILPGGGDLHPQFYGEEANAKLVDLDPELDEFQLDWAKRAQTQKLPTLGICRGMQVMNVAAGGTLHQDLDGELDHYPDSVRLDASLRRLPVHTVSLESRSRLHGLMGAQNVKVNSVHHQAIKKVAETFRAVAWAEDGLVEAIEGHEVWQVGVQFHPEDLRHTDPRLSELFADLVAASRKVS